MTPKIIDQLVHLYNSKPQTETLGEFLDREIKRSNYFREQVASIFTEREQIRFSYEKTNDELDKRLRKVQEECPHLTSTFTPDPSGNNDSYYTCNICGKIL